MNAGMTKKRDAPISYRPPESLRAEFRARLERSGMSASGYITQCVFAEAGPRAARSTTADRQLIARLLAETARLHDRLLALEVGAEDAALLEAAMGDLRESAPRSCMPWGGSHDPQGQPARRRSRPRCPPAERGRQ